MAKKPTATGRPRLSASPTTQMGVKLSEDEKALLVRAATKDNRTLSNWSRIALVSEAKRQLGIDPDATESR